MFEWLRELATPPEESWPDQYWAGIGVIGGEETDEPMLLQQRWIQNRGRTIFKPVPEYRKVPLSEVSE